MTPAAAVGDSSVRSRAAAHPTLAADPDLAPTAFLRAARAIATGADGAAP
jgi:hypothetical protein